MADAPPSEPQPSSAGITPPARGSVVHGRLAYQAIPVAGSLLHHFPLRGFIPEPTSPPVKSSESSTVLPPRLPPRQPASPAAVARHCPPRRSTTHFVHCSPSPPADASHPGRPAPRFRRRSSAIHVASTIHKLHRAPQVPLRTENRNPAGRAHSFAPLSSSFTTMRIFSSALAGDRTQRLPRSDTASPPPDAVHTHQPKLNTYSAPSHLRQNPIAAPIPQWTAARASCPPFQPPRRPHPTRRPSTAAHHCRRCFPAESSLALIIVSTPPERHCIYPSSSLTSDPTSTTIPFIPAGSSAAPELLSDSMPTGRSHQRTYRAPSGHAALRPVGEAVRRSSHRPPPTLRRPAFDSSHPNTSFRSTTDRPCFSRRLPRHSIAPNQPSLPTWARQPFASTTTPAVGAAPHIPGHRRPSTPHPRQSQTPSHPPLIYQASAGPPPTPFLSVPPLLWSCCDVGLGWYFCCLLGVVWRRFCYNGWRGKNVGWRCCFYVPIHGETQPIFREGGLEILDHIGIAIICPSPYDALILHSHVLVDVSPYDIMLPCHECCYYPCHATTMLPYSCCDVLRCHTPCFYDMPMLSFHVSMLSYLVVYLLLLCDTSMPCPFHALLLRNSM